MPAKRGRSRATSVPLLSNSSSAKFQGWGTQEPKGVREGIHAWLLGCWLVSPRLRCDSGLQVDEELDPGISADLEQSIIGDDDPAPPPPTKKSRFTLMEEEEDRDEDEDEDEDEEEREEEEDGAGEDELDEGLQQGAAPQAPKPAAIKKEVRQAAASASPEEKRLQQQTQRRQQHKSADTQLQQQPQRQLRRTLSARASEPDLGTSSHLNCDICSKSSADLTDTNSTHATRM